MYGIHRIEKRCRRDVYGLQLEANRTVKDHLNGREFPGSDIDWLKTRENVFLKRDDNWNKTISDTLKEKGIKTRKNSIVLLDSIYTASAEFFEDKSKEEIIDYFKACLEFHEKTYGKHTLNAVIHFDEVGRGKKIENGIEMGFKYGNVHCHISSIPILDKKDGTCTLSARDLMGNRTDYRKRQDDFYEQVSSMWGLERGEVKDYGEVRKHINKMEYEAQEASLKAQKAKAELNIRERVNEACKSQSEPLEVIKTNKSMFGREETVVIKKEDFERLKSQVSSSQDLKNGLAALERLAKETIEASAIDEKVLLAERERDQANERFKQLERTTQSQTAILQKTIQEQHSQIEYFSDYISKLERLLNIVQDWLKSKRLYAELVKYLELKDNEIERNHEREYEYTQEL